ncbi:MAG: multidrug transporter [Bacteroidetes bacterium]|nr:multidrug transporter [Bacteroidota bacterium]
MSKSTKWFLAILGVLAVIAIVFTLAMVSFVRNAGERTDTVSSGSGEKIALVELKGVITTSEDIVRQLKKYRDQSSVRAILLRIDSPGGGVVASQEMYEEVRKVRESGKPVVVSMGAIAASGGYYVACGASYLVANRGTLTGSIGVISEFLQLQELLGKIGVDFKTIKSGKLKDAGSSSRRMTEEDQRYFQQLIDNVHGQFRHVVQAACLQANRQWSWDWSTRSGPTKTRCRLPRRSPASRGNRPSSANAKCAASGSRWSMRQHTRLLPRRRKRWTGR